MPGERDNRDKPLNSMTLYAQYRRRRAEEMLGCALTANTADLLNKTASAWAVRLTFTELANCAFAALPLLDPGDRMTTFSATHLGVM